MMKYYYSNRVKLDFPYMFSLCGMNLLSLTNQRNAIYFARARPQAGAEALRSLQD